LTCVDTDDSSPSRDCRRCYFSQTPALDDRFYLEAVRPYCWLAAVLLFLSYIIGLWFTLRTHAAVIWNTDIDEKKQQLVESNPTAVHQPLIDAPSGRLQRQLTHNSSAEAARTADIRDSQLYKKILGQSLKQVGLGPRSGDNTRHNSTTEPPSFNGPNGATQTPHMVPPKSSGGDSVGSDMQIPGLTDAQNTILVREVAEMAATAATIAARDATRAPRKASASAHPHTPHTHRPPTLRTATIHAEDEEAVVAEAGGQSGGHDAPNWSRTKSSVILLGATILYALIAEILVNTVDVVLEGFAIDEKFLGITLFALVPNTTEFLVSKHIRCK
jgi:Ca2+:H+ antiporter